MEDDQRATTERDAPDDRREATDADAPDDAAEAADRDRIDEREREALLRRVRRQSSTIGVEIPETVEVECQEPQFGEAAGTERIRDYQRWLQFLDRIRR